MRRCMKRVSERLRPIVSRWLRFSWRSRLVTSGDDANLTQFVDEAMRRYVAKNPKDMYAARSYPYDLRRFVRALDWLGELQVEGLKVLDLGQYGIASYVIQGRFPRNEFTTTTTDLRKPLPYPDDQFDLVLNMEVVEHLADLEYAHATVLSGVRHCLSEVRRVLKVGGRMFLSTPNACSLLVIDRALRGDPPWQYPFHFREFTPQEIQILVEESGTHIRKCRTEYVWSSPGHTPALVEFIRQSNLDSEARGDDIFLVAQKTRQLPVPRGSLGLPV